MKRNPYFAQRFSLWGAFLLIIQGLGLGLVGNATNEGYDGDRVRVQLLTGGNDELAKIVVKISIS